MEDWLDRSSNAAPLVSIIMPVRNGSPYLRFALDSMLGQTFTRWELCVLNDGSTDDTSELLRNYAALDHRIHVFENSGPPFGVAKGLNTLMSYVAPGAKYVARMDADDVMHHLRLLTQVEFLENNGGVDIAFSRAWLMNARSQVTGLIGGGGWKQRGVFPVIQVQELLRNGTSPLCHSTAMWRHGLVEDMGGYDTRWGCAEDFDLWIRCCLDKRNLVVLPNILMYYRSHLGSVSSTRVIKQLQEARAIVSLHYGPRGHSGKRRRTLTNLRFFSHILLSSRIGASSDQVIDILEFPPRIRRVLHSPWVKGLLLSLVWILYQARRLVASIVHKTDSSGVGGRARDLRWRTGIDS